MSLNIKLNSLIASKAMTSKKNNKNNEFNFAK